ncbi:hypothetical protein RHMOL_Rhmol06G0211900 [Rhododendron molle]|uniref:Uncharacterized protein n=1 Tax=Rhododendron molle TaxID=49168 RepID=A0ACC0NEI5_RHOML|nr:hypothetical protein RHMOL_Rhmol06G0211900 [Rhododendron molle]
MTFIIFLRFSSFFLCCLNLYFVAGFCLRVVSICQVMPSPNGSEHVLSSCAPLRVQRGIKKATAVNETKPLTGDKKATNQTPLEVQGDEKMVGPTEPTVVVMKFPRRSPLP